MDIDRLLSHPDRDQRLQSLERLSHANEAGIHDRPQSIQVNNHVHTTYSFSPYSPSAAAWQARWSGLRAVGSVDHDSIAAAPETIRAGKILGIGTTVGCEVRVNFTGTSVEGKRINNPDSPNLVYMVLHGVPHNQIDTVDAFLAPLRSRRGLRNQAQTQGMNQILEKAGAPQVEYDDVLSSSMAHQGGGVTERHILYVCCRRLMEWMGAGPRLRAWVENHLTGSVSPRLRQMLDDPANPHYVYDLLGALKSSFLPLFFIQPDETECIHVSQVVDFGNSISAIPAYAYLGDVGESPTGDKKAARFEDDFLDELFLELVAIGFRAVTYMPPRNTAQQLKRVQDLCARHDLFQISGVDINSSRQVFTCEEILLPQFRHLVDATWALIAHEKLATADPERGLFRTDASSGATLDERVHRFAQIGRAIDPAHPENAPDIADRQP